MNWMKKLEEIDPELAEQARYDLANVASANMVKRAERHLIKTIAKYDYDATGQDGEEEIDAATEDYVDTQIARMKLVDPDRYAEMMAGA
jgi:hypothetical protein